MKFGLYAFIFLIIKRIKLAHIEILNENSVETKYQNIDYLKAYQISNLKMRYHSNGGSTYNHNLSLAFNNDDSNLYWQSEKKQQDSFLNNIKIAFSETITIDRMIYQAPSFFREKATGYPTELKIYYKFKNLDGSFNEDDSDFLLFDDIISDKTESRVLFLFDQELTCDQIKLEWIEIDSTYFRSAYATEIKFLFPENELLIK